MTDDLPRTLIDIARVGMAPHDYPRASERLGPIEPGRAPRDHVHSWSPGTNPGDPLICRECGHEEYEQSMMVADDLVVREWCLEQITPGALDYTPTELDLQISRAYLAAVAERDEALMIAEGPSSLKDLVAWFHERGAQLAAMTAARDDLLNRLDNASSLLKAANASIKRLQGKLTASEAARDA